MSTEDFMLCESQTSIDLDGFETIDVRSIDLQETYRTRWWSMW